MSEPFKTIGDPEREITRLAEYVQGFADANQSSKLSRAAEWLKRLAHNVCGQGYIGCHCGKDCNSDHK